MQNLSPDQKYDLAVKRQQAARARHETAHKYNSVDNSDTQLLLNKIHRQYKKLMSEIRLLEHMQLSKNIASEITNII